MGEWNNDGWIFILSERYIKLLQVFRKPPLTKSAQSTLSSLFFWRPCMIANPRKQVPPCPRGFLLEIKALPRWPDPSAKSTWPMQKHMIHGMRRRSKTRSKKVWVFRWEPAKTPNLTLVDWLIGLGGYTVILPFLSISSIAIAGIPFWTTCCVHCSRSGGESACEKCHGSMDRWRCQRQVWEARERNGRGVRGHRGYIFCIEG